MKEQQFEKKNRRVNNFSCRTNFPSNTCREDEEEGKVNEESELGVVVTARGQDVPENKQDTMQECNDVQEQSQLEEVNDEEQHYHAGVVTNPDCDNTNLAIPAVITPGAFAVSQHGEVLRSSCHPPDDAVSTLSGGLNHDVDQYPPPPPVLVQAHIAPSMRELDHVQEEMDHIQNRIARLEQENPHPEVAPVAQVVAVSSNYSQEDDEQQHTNQRDHEASSRPRRLLVLSIVLLIIVVAAVAIAVPMSSSTGSNSSSVLGGLPEQPSTLSPTTHPTLPPTKISTSTTTVPTTPPPTTTSLRTENPTLPPSSTTIPTSATTVPTTPPPTTTSLRTENPTLPPSSTTIPTNATTVPTTPSPTASPTMGSPTLSPSSTTTSPTLSPTTTSNPTQPPTRLPTLRPTRGPTTPTRPLPDGPWQPIGQVLNGNVLEDYFGESVSLSRDGNKVMAVGAAQDRDEPDLGSGGSGYVVVFRQSQSQQWIPLGQALMGDVGGDEFGKTISMNGDGTILAAGASWNDSSGGDNAGHVRVFEYDSDAKRWNQLGSDIDGKIKFGRFGNSVSLSDAGDFLAVGAFGEDTASGSRSGTVRVFRFDKESASWVQLGQTLDGQAANDKFGFSVSLNGAGTVVGVGARFDDAGGSDTGQVSVYEYDPSLALWVPLGNPISGQVIGGSFGYSVSLDDSGLVVAVGAPGTIERVMVYAHDRATSTWTQRGQTLFSQQPGDEFGEAVSLSAEGNVVAAGSDLHNFDGRINVGQVAIFQYDTNSMEWGQVGSRLNGEGGNDRFGYSVSLSANGSVVAAGARLRNANNITDSGSTYAFFV